MIKAGVTGTSTGASPEQLATLRNALSSLSISELHHGDCVGVDAEADLLFRSVNKNGRIIIHPPLNPKLRASCGQKGDDIREEKDYLIRNRDIASECDLLYVVPVTSREHLRSGTWSTARYAYAAGKLVLVIQGDGSIRVFVPEKSPLP